MLNILCLPVDRWSFKISIMTNSYSLGEGIGGLLGLIGELCSLARRAWDIGSLGSSCVFTQPISFPHSNNDIITLLGNVILFIWM